MSKDPAARLVCSWGGGVVVELSVSKRNWSKILRGSDVTIRGQGYNYDGEFYWDYWDFSGGVDGAVIVRYGRPKDGGYSGQGFIGALKEVSLDSL